MKDKIEELKIIAKSEKNKVGILEEKLKNFKEIFNCFVDRTDEISEVLNFSSGDLLM